MAATTPHGSGTVHGQAAGLSLVVVTIALPPAAQAEPNLRALETLAPGGGFLDNGPEFGVCSRLNLYAAGGKAAALEASIT